MLDEREAKLLTEVQKYFQSYISPLAATLDHSCEALEKAFLNMGNQNWLALRVSENWGGLGLSEQAFHSFQILMARYSGALCFVQTQHQAAGMQLAKSSNQSLQQSYLPYLASGKKLLGVGFSQLRRQGEPLMKAIAVAGGYQLSGIVPWVTGWGIFPDFIIAATLPTGEAVYGIVPLKTIQQDRGGSLQVSQPLELAVMESTNTVTVTVQDWFLVADLVVSLQAAEAIHEQDRQNALHHGFFALGCAWAGLDILEAAYQQKTLPFLLKAFNLWQSELNCLQEKMLGTIASGPDYEEQLQWRAQAIALAGKYAQASVAACSGQANLLSHPAQRVYREALLFTVSGQTTAVMGATIEQLLSQNILD